MSKIGNKEELHRAIKKLTGHPFDFEDNDYLYVSLFLRVFENNKVFKLVPANTYFAEEYFIARSEDPQKIFEVIEKILSCNKLFKKGIK